MGLVPIISSIRAARIICRKWEKLYHHLPDAFVVENLNRAGGHLGAKSHELGNPALNSEQVIPDLVQYLRSEVGEDILVIAAGGIWERRDIDRVLSLGAKGVQIGTRFITTEECDADRRYKEFHLQASPEDIVIAPSPVGMPGRVIRNAFAEKAMQRVAGVPPVVATASRPRSLVLSLNQLLVVELKLFNFLNCLACSCIRS